MKSINENIAYAKSILNKTGIKEDSPEYEDYLKIRQMVNNDHGYVGILTKLRFVDNVKDFDELNSIYEILKKQKFDFAKLNKLTYEQILDMFYDELSGDKNKNEDYELIYKDSQYSYFKIYTYKGILKMGSPTWCLKTKSHWDNYQKKYGEQWVVIDNRHLNKLPSPDSGFSKYENTNGWVRYGISIKNEANTMSFIGFSENNTSMEYNPSSYTYFGVINTIMNLSIGIKKSYYEYFYGCIKSEYGPILKVTNNNKFNHRITKNNDNSKLFNDEDQLYVAFSKTYSNYPYVTAFNSHLPKIHLMSTKKDHDKDHSNFLLPLGKFTSLALDDYASENKQKSIWFGVNLKNGIFKLEDLNNNDSFIKTIKDKWALFDHNDKYFLVVNLDPKEYQLPVYKYDEATPNIMEYNDPLYFYINKNSKECHRIKFAGMDSIIKEVFKRKNIILDDTPIDTKGLSFSNTDDEDSKKKVKGFFDFFKGKKSD